MRYQMMAVYDSKACAFLTPFFVSHLNVGVRAVTNAVNDPAQTIARNPGDFTLYHLGTFDDENAGFSIFTTPVAVGVATQWKLVERNGDLFQEGA